MPGAEEVFSDHQTLPPSMFFHQPKVATKLGLNKPGAQMRGWLWILHFSVIPSTLKQVPPSLSLFILSFGLWFFPPPLFSDSKRNWHNLKWTILKWTIQGHLVYSQYCTTTPLSSSKTFWSSQKRTLYLLSCCSLFPLPPYSSPW